MAWRVEIPGATPVFAGVELPAPGPGQVIIDIQATGLNFADLLMIKGTYQDFFIMT